MTIRDSLLTASSRKRVAATVLAMLALAGRASGGNPNSGDPAPCRSAMSPATSSRRPARR